MRKIHNPKNEIAHEGLEIFHHDFLTSREVDLVVLSAALASADFVSVMALGHRWKGYSAPYGFGQLALLATELESAAHNQSLEVCHQLAREITEYLLVKRNPTER
jgi:HPt (histidine-containing phosphotransfer) domain-containing protein